MNLNQLLCLPHFAISKIECRDTTVTINASVKSRRSRCPTCGRYSNSVHDSYYRHVTDIQVSNNSTHIILKTRKFKCRNSKCSQRVFTEQTTAVKRYSRRTTRAGEILNAFSIELTGKLGSQLSKQLFLGVSISTITRIAHNQLLPTIKQPRVLGVDDWAFRKGVRFGTVLIDMETSRPIDLLQTRESADLKAWLAKYPGAEIVTRDRSGSYASAINEVCPEAFQVADRFHLLVNLSEALDTYFKSINREIRRIIEDKTDEILSLAEAAESSSQSVVVNKSSVPTKMLISSEIRTDQRLTIFQKVKELRKDGTPLKNIARILGISRNTVKSYCFQETLAPKSHSKVINIELFTGYILNRLAMSGFKKIDIFNEIVALGYNGGCTQAYSYMKKIYTEYGMTTPNSFALQQKMIPYIKQMSSRKLARYIGANLSDIEDSQERNCMITLIGNSTELQIVRKLAQLFRTIIK